MLARSLVRRTLSAYRLENSCIAREVRNLSATGGGQELLLAGAVMISPAALLKQRGWRVGRLLVYLKAVCVYFLVGGEAEGAGAVAAKCAPVLCLVALVLLHAHAATNTRQQAAYCRLVALGLSLSAVGDAALVGPSASHFVCGMAAFACAHLAYLRALGWRPLRPLLGALCFAPAAAYLLLLRPPGVLRALVPAYAALLAAVWWRALARGGRAAAGATLFLVSDALLGYGMFGGALPHRRLLVMATYYMGQLGIALSALETPVETDNDAPAVTAAAQSERAREAPAPAPLEAPAPREAPALFPGRESHMFMVS